MDQMRVKKTRDTEIKKTNTDENGHVNEMCRVTRQMGQMESTDTKML